MAARVSRDDPAHGAWCVTSEHLIVWADASSLETGVVLEDASRGHVVEDVCWLRPESKSATHINMAELDAALSSVNRVVGSKNYPALYQLGYSPQMDK